MLPLLIEGHRTLDLAAVRILRNIARVEVDVLESAVGHVVLKAILGRVLVLSVVRIGHHLVTMVFAGESVGKLVVRVLANQLL